MLRVQCFTFNAFKENTYVVYDDTRACAIIDPGCYEQHEQETLSAFIEENALQVVHLVNTHAHIDRFASTGNTHTARS
jgi:hydroxyacylglutathione hydrolase